MPINREEDTLYNLDRTIASLFGAPPQETISSQIGRAALKGKRWGKAGQWFLDRVVFRTNHCEKAVAHADALTRIDDGFTG